LRRRNNYDSINLRKSVDVFFTTLLDVTLNGIENPVSNYAKHVWESISFEDYVSLLQKTPNETIENSELYQEYRTKIKAKTAKEFWNTVLERESEKLYYFILTYPQKVVLVKSGEKDAEKRFLGYEFSNRRGSEGIHPIQRGKAIDECTKLFDPKVFDNPEKASTYIYKAFLGNTDFPIDDSIKENISYANLVDMLTFDRADFEKNISLAVKKKVKFESRWELVKIGQIATAQYGYTDKATDIGDVRYLRITDLNEDGSINLNNAPKFVNPNDEIKSLFLLKNNDIVIARSGSVGKAAIFKSDKYPDMIFASYLIRLQVDENKMLPDYLHCFTQTAMYWNQVEINSVAVTQPNLNAEKIKEFKIPFPPKDIQQKIVDEIASIEAQENDAKNKIIGLKNKIEQLFSEVYQSATETYRLSDANSFSVSIGKRIIARDLAPKGNIPVYSANVFEPFGNMDKLLVEDFTIPSVLWGIDGDWMVNYMPENKPFYPTDHCGVLRVLNKNILPKYVAWVLNKEGINIGFSRQLRASIDRITGISIKIPPIALQQKIVSEIETVEKQITEAQKTIDNCADLKNAILKKYLYHG
jgi:type I restriction enzyme M protein